MNCELQTGGRLELYFYGELATADALKMRAHVEECNDCAQALDDLRTIRAALAGRPDVAAPPGGDWSGFMARLDAATGKHAGRVPRVERPSRSMVRRAAPYLALAAILTIVTVSVLLIAARRAGEPPRAIPLGAAVSRPAVPAPAVHSDPALAAVSGEHFERSKLVLLGLTTMDATARSADDWQYERTLAGSLLGDTRLYRQAAEDRGMTALAGVMRDLELVLLQTSMSEAPDADSIGQLQRLIRRRDLLTKMDIAYEGGS